MKGGGRRESKVEGLKGLRVRNGMEVIGEVIACPRRFGSKGDIGGGEEEEFASKVAEGSVRINGEGEKEDFGGVEESKL
jgi:hypothetical protein